MSKMVGEYLFGGSVVKVPSEPELNTTRVATKFMSNFLIDDPNTYVGIEVEVERVLRKGNLGDFTNGHSLWRNTEDNSLRNNGREFVSVPLKGENIPYALSVLNSHLKKDKTCIAHEFTDRTSVHIHMNTLDFTVEQLLNFVLSYLLVEPLLYTFVGGDRAKNIFCVPITESTLDEVLAQAIHYYERGDTTSALTSLRSWQKYTGLNLLPLFQYGTVEFRHMVGTADEELLTTWINIILSIKKFAITSKYEDIKTTILSINSSSEYSQTLYEICGNYAHLLDKGDLQGVMERTSLFIKEVYAHRQNKDVILTLLHKVDKTKIKFNKFFINCANVGLIQMIDVAAKIKKLEENIRVHAFEITKVQLEIARLDELLENKGVKLPIATKRKYLRAQEELRLRIPYYKDVIERSQSEIDNLNGVTTIIDNPVMAGNNIIPNPRAVVRGVFEIPPEEQDEDVEEPF